jgi:DNA modification methylase
MDMDTDDLFKQLGEASEDEVPKDWLTNGLDEDQIPEHLQEFFEEREITKVLKYRNNHPTLKPIAVMEVLMKDIPPGSLIVDPFMGSGTTGIASLNLGLDFIGIEQDADYLRIAHHRIHHADAATASWNAADIQSEVVEETPKATSLKDLFGL